MPKSFRQLREQSIHIGSGKKPLSRHSATHRREPHVSHELTTAPTGAHDRPKKKLNELLGALAAGAIGGALAYRAVTRPGGVVDRVQKERKRKEHLKSSIKKSEERTKALKDQLRKTSVVKAALNMSRESFEYSLDEELTQKRRQQLRTMKGAIKNQQLYGNHPYFGKKRQQQDRIMDKITARLNKEEAAAVSVAGGAVPSITDPTTNYAAQLKKKINMIRRKKPV